MKNFGSALSYNQLSFIIYDHSSIKRFSQHYRYFQRKDIKKTFKFSERYFFTIYKCVVQMCANEGRILKSGD